jgi:hypothetical protein
VARKSFFFFMFIILFYFLAPKFSETEERWILYAGPK